MKVAIQILACILLGGMAQASQQPVAEGTASLYNSARSYELVIDGSAAEKMFNTLDTQETTVNNWVNKVGQSIVCGKNLSTKQFSCSLSVDERGVQ